MPDCTRCGAKTIRTSDDYLCFSRVLGYALAPRVEIDECSGCGLASVSSEAEKEVYRWLSIHEQIAIDSLSGDQLLSAGQAAEMLGVTKQAFSKNPKVKKGHIYFTSVGNKKIYFKSSVELFKDSGDGRFQITKWQSSLPSEQTTTNVNGSECWQSHQATHVSDYTWSSSSKGSQ